MKRDREYLRGFVFLILVVVATLGVSTARLRAEERYVFAANSSWQTHLLVEGQAALGGNDDVIVHYSNARVGSRGPLHVTPGGYGVIENYGLYQGVDAGASVLGVTTIDVEGLAVVHDIAEFDDGHGHVATVELPAMEYALGSGDDGADALVLRGVQNDGRFETWIAFWDLDPVKGADLQLDVLGQKGEFVGTEYVSLPAGGGLTMIKLKTLVVAGEVRLKHLAIGPAAKPLVVGMAFVNSPVGGSARPIAMDLVLEDLAISGADSE